MNLDIKSKPAKVVYQTMLDALEDRKWQYHADEENQRVAFSVSSNQIHMQFLMSAETEGQYISLLSFFPFCIDEHKKVEVALATSYINYSLINGHFDMDLNEGRVLFRVTCIFDGSLLSKDVIQYMIDCACSTVNRYHPLLFQMNAGTITVDDLITFIHQN
ncbi:MAG: YbjN domain-containing protein [Anaeroplasma bactoclasticum]|nr:YbjN domain-containing protein [Anaeroplasma bactoclasticum]